jgi:F-type H+-transporting ATPase subunit delta
MSVTRIASRYAKSLIELAIERNELDVVRGDMEVFNKAIESRDLLLMLKSPVVNADKKEKIFELLFSDKFSPLTMGFCKILLNKGREYYLPEIIEAFFEQYKSHKNITTIKIISAAPLEKENLSTIKTKVLSLMKTSNELELVLEVNPDLIGGYILEFDNKKYDASISHQLDQLKMSFGENLHVKNF